MIEEENDFRMSISFEMNIKPLYIEAQFINIQRKRNFGKDPKSFHNRLRQRYSLLSKGVLGKFYSYLYHSRLCCIDNQLLMITLRDTFVRDTLLVQLKP